MFLIALVSESTGHVSDANHFMKVLFRVRSFFLDHTASRDGSLKEVHFMAPTVPGEEPFDKQCNELVRRVFQADSY